MKKLLFCSALLAVPALPQAPVQQSGTGSSSARQLPLSGRSGESGSVNTNQSTVNAGGTNSVNLINSTVIVNGPYQGSAPTGTSTGTIVPITLDYALKLGLQYNLGTLVQAQSIRSAQGQRYEALNALLPNISGVLREDVQQTNLKALGVNIQVPGFSFPPLSAPSTISTCAPPSPRPLPIL